ncbi:MAG TPA: 50S ribosomal protein L11 methyltransferase [Oceanospirillales bacterium]|nr:50S ribosomal protein L11 methyltransferase [Oceanospirillales bacterium]
MSEKEYDYFEIKFPCHRDEVDACEALLLSIGACSVTYRDAQDVAILEPGPGKMPLWQDIEITGMFTMDADKKTILKAIKQYYPQRQVSYAKLQNQVWERTWLAHFKPMQFGVKTWIIPSEYETIDPQAINIYLDPGLAFGTGTHATTALCLQWIDANDLTGKKVIDFGCGSGILAIAALKHGASKVYCTDIDPQALESTMANASANKVEAGIEIIQGKDVLSIEKLDVVMANILAAPLLTLVDTFNSILRDGGGLIMSGILAEQTDEIVEKFSQSFVDFQIKITDDWASVFCRKKRI